MDHKSAKKIIFILLLIHIIPLWIFKFIPTQDGINHVYNAYILKEYNNPVYTKYREVYSLNIKPFPNWVSHAFFYLALYIMPPLIAEKVFVSLYMILTPLSFFYFYKSIDKRLWTFGFLGFLYNYNVLLHLGFYNFVFSVPLYFFTIGYWWRYREKLNSTHAIIINILLIFVYFSHLFSFALALLSVPLLSFTSAILPWDEPKSIKNRFWIFLRSNIYILPCYIILVLCLLLNPEEKTAGYKSSKELWDFFISIKSLVYFNDRYIYISWVLLGVMCLFFVLTLYFKIRSLFVENKGKLKNFLKQSDGFFLLFVVLTILFFKLPWAYGPPAWINDRVNLFLFPVLTAFFVFRFPDWLKVTKVAVIILLSLAHLGLTIYDYNLLNKDMKEFTSGAGLIAGDSTITIRTRDMAGDFHNAENHGTIKYLSPFFHDTCYYCFGNGSHYVGNYEPKYAYFPLRYKEGYWKFEYKGTIDYILTWFMDENSPEIEELKKDYRIIHKTKNMMLFRHKQS